MYALTNIFRRKNVSYRRFGAHGEHERPMIHRFEVKGGDTLLQVMARNITAKNPLLQQLMKKGKST